MNKITYFVMIILPVVFLSCFHSKPILEIIPKSEYGLSLDSYHFKKSFQLEVISEDTFIAFNQSFNRETLVAYLHQKTQKLQQFECLIVAHPDTKFMAITQAVQEVAKSGISNRILLKVELPQGETGFIPYHLPLAGGNRPQEMDNFQDYQVFNDGTPMIQVKMTKETFIMETTPIAQEQLADRLKELSQNKSFAVQLRATEDTSYQEAINAINACISAKAKAFFFSY